MNKGILVYNQNGKIYGTLFSPDMEENHKSIYLEMEDNQEITGLDLTGDVPAVTFRTLEREPTPEELKLENESLSAKLDYYQMKAEVQ